MTIVLNGSSGITNDGGYTGDGVVFADTTPANTLVTTTGGNVGIGTSSPGAKLEVWKDNIRFGNDAATGVYGLQWWRSGAERGRVAMDASASLVEIQADGEIRFLTAGENERARIDSSGNLLVGKTSTSSSTLGCFFMPGGIVSGVTSGDSWYCSKATGYSDSSFIRFQINASSVGTITTNGTSTAYNTSSDYRLKENIVPMTGALAKVQALKPVTYTWKATGEQDEGFIAHELQEVKPQCVTGEKDAVDAEGKPVYQGIDTSFLVATLTAAIQELKAIVDAQSARITALEGTQP